MDYFITQKVRDAQRFGFGSRLGAPASLTPRQQLAAKEFFCAELKVLPSTQDHFVQISAFNQQKRAAKKDPEKLKQLRKSINRYNQHAWQQQLAARHQQVILTPNDFQERLIHFWSNHFTVSGDKRPVKPMCAAIENEVIRSLWAGNFADMLLAVTRHPAMLLYLDNHRSLGPNSRMGKRTQRGLNENLAREILELHTLGVNGPYRQQDVQEFAKALTGWRVSYSLTQPGFQFVENAHEPGKVTVLGKAYAQKGELQARAILSDLALMPETATFLAQKLAQHFLGSDEPSVIRALSESYLRSKGELRAVYQVLLDLPEANQSRVCRFRSPQQWCYALIRSCGAELPTNAISRALTNMGQAPFMASSPAGYPDVDEPYNSPVGLRQRWMVANQFAQHVVKALSKEEALARSGQLGEFLYGDGLDEHYQAVASKSHHAATRMALLWLSPQFQYR